jgi:hypothetical protein
VARGQKKVTGRHATLAFTDESGFLLPPLVRRTLARRAHAAPLGYRGRHREEVSAAAALTPSPSRGHAGPYSRTYPNAHVNAAAYADFLRGLLRRCPNPPVVAHDRGNMHFGDPVRQLQRDFPRLDLNLLPPYAPELNPPEQLWNSARDKELSNFVPRDVDECDAALNRLLEAIRHDQRRLRTFFAATPLPWDPLTVFF